MVWTTNMSSTCGFRQSISITIFKAPIWWNWSVFCLFFLVERSIFFCLTIDISKVQCRGSNNYIPFQRPTWSLFDLVENNLFNKIYTLYILYIYIYKLGFLGYITIANFKENFQTKNMFSLKPLTFKIYDFLVGRTCTRARFNLSKLFGEFVAFLNL